ncbi:thiamine phosphate synthase, partial [Microbaculum marinum]|uniref:thiamine phosphate synthase n=1 Tax=Microbaculum marinum TaxID=1764581 RepID=UPI0036228C3A
TRSGARDPGSLAAAAVAGGATLIQLRDKQASTRRFVEEARLVRAAMRGSGVPLLINDRVDVALAVAAEGVHLGQDDMDARDARRQLGPNAIIGLTIKNEADVDSAPIGAIDYVAIGGVFETLSKDNPDKPVGIDGLTRLIGRVRARRPNLPVCAIAGINDERVPGVIGAGADGVAIISAIFMADDAEAAARGLRITVDRALEARGAATGSAA